MSGREFNWGWPSTGGFIPASVAGQTVITIDFVIPDEAGLHPHYRPGGKVGGSVASEVRDRLFGTFMGPLWRMLEGTPGAAWGRVSLELHHAADPGFRPPGWEPPARVPYTAPDPEQLVDLPPVPHGPARLYAADLERASLLAMSQEITRRAAIARARGLEHDVDRFEKLAEAANLLRDVAGVPLFDFGPIVTAGGSTVP